MSQKTQSIHAEAGLHRKLVLFAVQLEGYLAHFPNCHKYTLTQGIRQAYLDVYNLVTECQKRYHKKTTLTQLDVRHEQLRMMIHLAHELGLFNYSAGTKDAQAPGERRYLVILRMVDELGRMIGGWVNAEIHGREPANAVEA
ncbi:MAG: four helix bundle protein [Rhodoferax sp.]|nr:four helix bundle protein [Rhodoferax sp.]MDP3651042.1 four helix bundle protein [Rhodoferax sp.]